MLTIFCSYVGFIWNKYGILPSISDSYYYLPDNDKILFTLFCWLFSFPAIILGSSPLMFLAGTGIIFVGTAPAFKKDLVGTVHRVGATIAVSASQLSIYFDYHMLYLNIIFISLSLIFLFFNKWIQNKIWWIEILAFWFIVYAIAMNLFQIIF
jgi:hypothetical protein